MPRWMGALKQLSGLKLDEAIAGIISDAGVIPMAQEQIETIVAEQTEATVAEQISRAPADTMTHDGAPWIPSNGKKIETDLGAVLGNTAYGFTKPNILDVKLGERLWADDAPAAKKLRFDKIASETTHKNMGFRIAGMRVFRGSNDEAQLDSEGYRIYDKDYGRLTMNDDNILDGFRHFIFNKAAGIDKNLGRAVCAAFLRELDHIQAIIEKHETRMYSSSLLFVFEGDGAALRAAIEHNNDVVTAIETKFANRTTMRTDSGIAMDDDDELGNGDDDDYEDVDSDMGAEHSPPMFSLKLIDFAHAQWTPGKGPDENLLKGVRSVRDIFEQLSR